MIICGHATNAESAPGCVTLESGREISTGSGRQNEWMVFKAMGLDVLGEVSVDRGGQQSGLNPGRVLLVAVGKQYQQRG